jgi:pyruvate-ferredoxin/flavodoxin oxidoreductase
MPVDGTFPSGTAVWEKRNIADEVPVWREDLCIQCGQCSFVCPHSVIRAKYYDEAALEAAPDGFKSAPVNARGYPGIALLAAFYLEDCTGCGLCVEACPALSPVRARRQGDQSGRQGRPGGAERDEHGLLRGLPVNDRAASISPPCAACSFWSRPSSFPAPARAAARRPT